MAELTPKDYDLDTGEFIWSPHRGPLVLFGTLSSIWVLAWLVIVHKYKEMKLNKIVSLIQELGFLKSKCMKEGRYLDEIRDSERQFIYKRIGQQVFPYMDESRQKEFLEYDLNVPLPPMPSLSFSDKIFLSRIFTLRFISFNRLKQLTYSIYVVGIVISFIAIVVLSLSLIPDLISDQSSVTENDNLSTAIVGLVYSPTLFLFLIFVWKWKRGYKQSLNKQMNLLTKICENAENIGEIEKRLAQFILTDNATVNGLRNQKGNIIHPYLMFKKTNASWNFDMLTMSISRYDYVYFLYSLSALPLLVLILNFFFGSDEQTSALLTVFVNIVFFLSNFLSLLLVSFTTAFLFRYLFFANFRILVDADSKRVAIRREGRVPERYQRSLRKKLLIYSSITLMLIGTVISLVLFAYTRSYPIPFVIFILCFLPYLFISAIPLFAKSVKAETEKTADIRYVGLDQMFIKGFFAQYVWDIALACIVFTFLLVITLTLGLSFYFNGLIFATILWNVSLFAFAVSFIMLGFFIYYFFIQLIKNPINPSLSTILEEKEIMVMTSLSDPAILGEKNKERQDFRLSVLDVGNKFVEKYTRGRLWERLRAIATFLFSPIGSLILDYLL